MFKVKYGGGEYNVFEIKDSAGVTFYGIEDEPNHIDYVKAENCEIISGYAIKENGSPYPTKPVMFSEQPRAWSEEDEMMLECVLGKIGHYGTGEMCKDWLNSLKERCAPQPQYGYNPYKAVVESIAEMCKHYDKANHSGLRDFYDNVKVKCKDAKEYDSLFPQPTWKPSNEQMKALAIAIRCGITLGTWEEEALKDLIEQLKKLKG
jgi:hypothetical protein